MLAKIKPYLLIVLLAASLTSMLRATGASDVSLTCSDSGCTGISGAIFNEINLAPGDNISKTLTAVNNYAENRNFGVEVTPSNFLDSDPSLAQELNVTIKDSSGGSTLYGPKTIMDWKNDGLIVLSQMASGELKEFLFEISFNDVGNDYQGKSLNFDLNFGFEGGATASTSTTSTASSGSQVLGASSGDTLGRVLGLL